MSGKALPAVILVAVLAAGGMAGHAWWTEWRFRETTDNAYLAAEVTPIATKIAGHVVEVAVEDNQPVTAGAVLLRIEPRDFAARLAEREAAVEGARAGLANLEKRLSLSRAVIAQAAATLSASEAEGRRARQDLSRASRLVADEFVSRSRFDADQAQSAKAEALVAGARAGLDASNRSLDVLDSERAIAEATLRQAEAALELAQSELDATLPRAPIDGVVGNRAVRPGQYVRPGATLMSLVPLDRVWVEANFKETQIAAMRPGQRVEITVDAFPGVRLEGRLDGIAPASGAKFSLLPPENATGNFTKLVQRIPVKITLDQGPLAGRLRPGMSVVAAVVTGG